MGSAIVAKSASTAFKSYSVVHHKHLVCEIKVGLFEGDADSILTDD